MQQDTTGQFRKSLEADSQLLADRVDTPFDDVPDVPEFNERAFQRIQRTLLLMERERSRTLPQVEAGREGGTRPQSQGLVILGGPGTGKTHLLMRAARRFAGRNLMVFVKRHVDPEYVVIRIWQQLLDSLCQRIPGSEVRQLDQLLAHVVSHAVIAELRHEIAAKNEVGRDKERTIQRLTEDPFYVFRLSDSDALRRKAYQYVSRTFPETNAEIVHALLKYCFYRREFHRTAILAWLRGQQVPDGAQALQLPDSWLTVDEDASPASKREQRSELAFDAIKTIGYLSTTYHPLILAFDQLEALRGKDELSLRWGNAAQDIISYAPNFVVVTCMFPSTWQEWFVPLCQQRDLGSYLQRIGARQVPLDDFTPEIARQLVAKRLAGYVGEFDLPSDIYPFQEEDILRNCPPGISIREFVQRIRDEFEDWILEGELAESESAAVAGPEPPAAVLEPEPPAEPVTVEDRVVDKLSALLAAPPDPRSPTAPPTDEELREDVELLIEFVLAQSGVDARRAADDKLELPVDAICFQSQDEQRTLCLTVTSSARTPLYHELGRLAKSVSKVEAGWVLVRDCRCEPPASKSLARLNELMKAGLQYVQLTQAEYLYLHRLANVIRDVENHDFSVEGEHDVDEQTLFSALAGAGILHRSQVVRAVLAAANWLQPAFGDPAEPPRLASDHLVQQMISATLARQKQADSDQRLRPCFSLGTLVDVQLDGQHVRAQFRDFSPGLVALTQHLSRNSKKSGKRQHLLRLGESFVAGEVKLHKKDDTLIVHIWESALKDAQIDRISEDVASSMQLVGKDGFADTCSCLYNVLGRECPLLPVLFGLEETAAPLADRKLINTAAAFAKDLELSDQTTAAIHTALSQQVTFLIDQDDPGKRREVEAMLLFLLLWAERRVMIAFNAVEETRGVLQRLGQLLADQAYRSPPALLLGEASRVAMKEVVTSDLPFEWLKKSSSGAGTDAQLLVTWLPDLVRATSPANTDRLHIGFVDYLVVNGAGVGDAIPVAIAASHATGGMSVGGSGCQAARDEAADPGGNPSTAGDDWFEADLFKLARAANGDTRCCQI